jgi:hypothetical protein
MLSEEQAAHLIAIASGEVPDGHDHWTVRMLADKAVELGYAQRLSRETVRLLLKKVKIRPHSGGGNRGDNFPASPTQAKSVHFDVRPSSIRG